MPPHKPAPACRHVLAAQEATTVLVALFRRVRFELSPAHHPGGRVAWRFSLALLPQSGLWVHVKRR